MWSKFKALLAFLQVNNEIADAGKWKRREISAKLVAAFITALLGLAATFGYQFEISNVQIESVSMGVLSIYFMLDTIIGTIMTKHAGLPNKGSENGN